MFDLTQWLGIAILVVFSLGLSLFMRLDFSRRSEPALPVNLGIWEPCDEVPARLGARGEANDDLADEEGSAEIVEERRIILAEGGLFRRHRLLEQRRTRRVRDGEILRVEAPRVLKRWYGG